MQKQGNISGWITGRIRHRLIMVLVVIASAGLHPAVAQKQANFWYFGKKAALDFNGFDPIPLNNSQMDTPEGAAAISDTLGNLLFYTDGRNIWNASHQRINTDRLNGDPSATQSATIVPDPNHSDRYFVFTTRSFLSDSLTNFGGNYYTVQIATNGTGTIIYDYSKDTGKGGLAPNATEKFLAVPYSYAPGRTGYWFLMHEFNTNRFVKVRLDSTWHNPEYQPIGSIHQNDTIDDGTNLGAAGQMKANDLGTRIAVAVQGGHFFEVFRFDTSTGNLSGALKIPAGDMTDKFAYRYGAYGVEFSPTGNYGFEPTSGNYLYGSTRDGGPVYQWDLSQTDVTQLIKSGRVLYSDPEMRCGALQLAPNGKIYLAFEGQDFLGVIGSPMRPDCNFEESGARLVNNDTGLGGASGFGLPAPVPVIKEREPFYFENLCLGDETLFYITDQATITPTTPRVWIFKPETGSPITRNSTLNELKYTFPKPGKYGVTLRVFKSGNPVTYFRELTINPIPVVKLGAQDTVPLCRGDQLKLDAGFGAFYEWEDPKIKIRQRTITTDSVYPVMEYRVRLTDYHGCVGWDTLWVQKKIPPTLTSSSIKAFCGNKDGSATVVPNGKLTDYNYVWEGYPDEKSNVLSGINGGDYVVHVLSKTTPCEVIDTIHVDELGGSSVKIVSSGDPVICPGTPIQLNVTGAAEIEWLTPAGFTGSTVNVTLDTTTVFTVRAISRDEGRECPTIVTDTIRVFPKNKPELGADRTSCEGWTVEVDGGGEYTAWEWNNGQTGQIARIRMNTPSLVLHATDGNGCVFADTVAVRFMPSPEVNLGRDTAVCSRDPITLRGGTGEFYLWSTGETTPTIRVDSNGDYTLTITKDGCSLADTIHVQLNDPTKFRIDSIARRDISCNGAANGMIRVYASGDGRDFYYSIDKGLNYLDNGGIFTNVSPGGYEILVLEDSVCQLNGGSLSLSEPDSLVAKYCSLPPSCIDCPDGVISLGRISGGTPPYVVRMNGLVQRDSVITGLGLGNYTMTVTDSHECTISKRIALAAGTRPSITASTSLAICPGTPVTLHVENSPQVAWINPPGLTDAGIEVAPLQTTTYSVRCISTDADGFTCETILDHTVEVIPYVKPDIGDDIRTCQGDTVILDGGDYLSWTWSNGLSGRYISLIKPVDQLILTVTDPSGCYLKDTVTVGFAPHPAVELGKDRRVCSSVPLVLSGGTGGSYSWSTGEDTREISVTASGKYTLVITTDGCSSSDSVNISLLDPSHLTIDSVKTTGNDCFGESLGSIEIFPHGDGASYRYSIDDGITYQTGSLFNNLASGVDYLIRVSEDSLCYQDYGNPVTLAQPDSIRIAYRLKSPACETCLDGKLLLDISGGTPPYEITLSGVPVGLVTETLGIGSYWILVRDAAHCIKTVEFTLEMLNYVPNVITTNGDGVNDLWKIPMLKYYPDAVVRVFNMAGKLVYESASGYPVPWDGRDQGNPVPMGTYYYVINLGPGEQQVSGYLTVLR